jgi:hypothetical protein
MPRTRSTESVPTRSPHGHTASGGTWTEADAATGPVRRSAREGRIRFTTASSRLSNGKWRRAHSQPQHHSGDRWDADRCAGRRCRRPVQACPASTPWCWRGGRRRGTRPVASVCQCRVPAVPARSHPPSDRAGFIGRRQGMR